MSKQIVITFHEDGTCTIEMCGYSGRECFVDAAQLKDRLRKLGLEVQGEVVRPKKTELVVDGVCVRGE